MFDGILCASPCPSGERRSVCMKRSLVPCKMDRPGRFRRLGAKESGFMSQGGHLIGAILLGVSLGLIAPLVDEWTESRLWFWLIMALMFLPLFVITHMVADFVTRKLF